MAEFKFQLGDLVVTRVGAEEARLHAEGGVFGIPKVFSICERTAQECPGGVQLHYLLCSADTRFKSLEHELLAVTDHDGAATLAMAQSVVERRDAVKAAIDVAAWRERFEARKADKPDA